MKEDRMTTNENTPRRIILDRNTPVEMAIREAMKAVESAGADPLLTDAVVLLDQAREKVADWVDSQAVVHTDKGKYQVTIIRTVTEKATVNVVVNLDNTKIDDLFQVAHSVACAKEVWQREGKPEISQIKSSFELTHIDGEPVPRQT